MKRKERKENLIHGIFLIFGLITVAFVILITVYLVASGIPAICEIGLFPFLFGTKWASTAEIPKYGILPFILTSIYGTIGAILLGVPIGFFTAVYLSKMASPRVKEIVQSLIGLLSGIPSIIYGLVGMLLFSNHMGTCLMAGSLTLVMMNLPTIMRNTQESLKTVPQSYREGAFGLGAGKWRVIYTIILPNCVDGIFTGCILSVGRILGESAALLFTAGFAHTVHGIVDGLASSGATLTVALYVYAKEQGEFEVAFAIAAILMLLMIGIHFVAAVVQKYMERKRKL